MRFELRKCTLSLAEVKYSNSYLVFWLHRIWMVWQVEFSSSTNSVVLIKQPPFEQKEGRLQVFFETMSRNEARPEIATVTTEKFVVQLYGGWQGQTLHKLHKDYIMKKGKVIEKLLPPHTETSEKPLSGTVVDPNNKKGEIQAFSRDPHNHG